MNIDEQLKRILKFGEGRTFFGFANADGKRWMMPAHNMRTAMNLYQPSGIKGKLLKWGLPWLYWNPVVLRVLNAERLCLSFSDELRTLLENVFRENDLEFSVFCGTPCVHRKITLQVSCGSRIIGYVKVAASEEIGAIFEHERDILSDLHAKGISNVPQCLYCGKLACGLYIFVQTTLKTSHSKVMHEWTEMHSRFLNTLATRTRQTVTFEQTDFNHDLDRLENCEFSLDETGTVNDAIAEVKSHYAGKEVIFSAFQADFTPWNMFGENGDIFVFDWEYARLTYPPYLDYFHFIIQTAIFEKHLEVDEIVEWYRSQKNKCRYLHAEDQDFAFRCYLLAIISIYVQRERYPLPDDALKRINVWISLLNIVRNKS